MRKLTALIPLAAVLTAASPTAAHADRSYAGVQIPGGVVALRLSDSGRSLTAATMRFDLPCRKGGFMSFAGTLQLTGRAPARSGRGSAYLVRGRTSLDRRLIARDGTRRSYSEYLGRMRIDRVRAAGARLRLAVRLRDTEVPDDPCRVALTMRLVRNPGVIYAGATDDGEPVVLSRQDADSLFVVAGYGNVCRPRGFMQGLFFDTAPLAADGAFGWPQDTALGFRNGFRTRGTFAGRLEGAAAAGSLRLIGTAGSRRCDTRLRTFTATSE